MRIYLVANDVNGKLYVGQTIHSVKSRWIAHCTSKRCTALSSAIAKYGPEAFTVVELMTVDSLEELNLIEERLIAELNTLAPNGYNLRSGGENKKHSEISKARMSAVQKDVYKLKWGNGKFPNSGTKYTAEQRKRVSDGHKGIKQSQETIERRRLKLQKSVVCLATGQLFSSLYEAAEYCGISHKQVSRLARNGKQDRNGLSFEFVRWTPFAS